MKQKYTNEESLSTTYSNKTPDEFLKIVEHMHLRGFILIRSHENFFIWQKVKDKKAKSEYIRLSLNRTGWHEKTLFYWDLELSFKPWNYNHNHRQGAHEQSEYFKFNDLDRFRNYFLNMIDRIKEYSLY